MKRKLLIGAATLVISTISLADVTLKTDQDKLSYAMGVTTGQAFVVHNIPVTSAAFTQGMNDVMAGKKLAMSDSDIKNTLMAFQKQKMKEMHAQYDADAAKNLQAGQDFLAKNKTQPGVQTTADGLQYKVITAGSGKNPSLNDTVVVNYEGKLLNGQVFDSSYKRGEPATFPLKTVIQGWQEALVKMQPGAVWEVYIPANLAYGKTGVPGLIGPNEVLQFKVELIKIQ